MVGPCLPRTVRHAFGGVFRLFAAHGYRTVPGVRHASRPKALATPPATLQYLFFIRLFQAAQPSALLASQPPLTPLNCSVFSNGNAGIVLAILKPSSEGRSRLEEVASCSPCCRRRRAPGAVQQPRCP